MDDRTRDKPSESDATSDRHSQVARAVSDDVSAFAGLTGSFYRGEMTRVTTWRGRLDQTTNWAVVVMAAVLTWVFSSPDNPHYVLLVGMGAVLTFLVVEAHRFRQYDAWRSRMRYLQRYYFADVFAHSAPERPAWRVHLSEGLRRPTIDLSLARAVGHRLQRVYLPLLSVLLVAWWLRVTVFAPDRTWQTAAAVGSVPGVAVVAAVGAVYLAVLVTTVWSLGGTTEREFRDTAADDRETRRES